MNQQILSVETMEKLKAQLVNYISEESIITPNKKFYCFNKDHHTSETKPTAMLLPSKENNYWTCPKCGKGGNIFDAVALRENITDFEKQVEYLSSKYHIPLQYEEARSVPENTANYLGNIFEYNNTYCRLIKKDIVPLSNFIINPLYVVEGNSESEIAVEIKCMDGSTFYRTLNLNIFSDVLSFRKALNNLKLCFAGTVEQLQYIKSIMSSKPYKQAKGVQAIGFHKINGVDCFVTGDYAIDKNMQYFEGVSMMKSYEELSTNILDASAISKEELVMIGKSLFNFNTLNITSTIMGYIGGTFLKGKLMDNGIKYGHLIIEGQSGSGKSETIENIIMPIFSMVQSPMNASECTPFGLNRAASSSNFIPLIIDEYKPSKIGQSRISAISNIMRNSYDNHTVIKGVSSLKKNREFKVQASLILCGEGGITETANIERSLRVTFSPNFHNAARENHLKNLKRNKKLLKKLGRSLLALGMKMDSKHLMDAYFNLEEKLNSNIIKNSRVKNSIINACFGISTIKALFKVRGLDFEESVGHSFKEIRNAIIENAKSDLLDESTGSKSVIDYTLETINRMAINYIIRADYDYSLGIDKEGNEFLKLNYLSFYDKFLKYCKDHSIEHEILPLSSFKKQLGKTDYCISVNKPISFKISSGYINQYKTFRAAALDMKKLKELNLDLDFLMDKTI